MSLGIRLQVQTVKILLTGTEGNDQIFGGGQSDDIFGLGGNDIINGDAGDDTIIG